MPVRRRYRFTSSTSFADPGITIGRVFGDTFAAETRRKLYDLPCRTFPSPEDVVDEL